MSSLLLLLDSPLKKIILFLNNHLETLITIILGALITWIVSNRFYQKAEEQNEKYQNSLEQQSIENKAHIENMNRNIAVSFSILGNYLNEPKGKRLGFNEEGYITVLNIETKDDLVLRAEEMVKSLEKESGQDNN